MAEERVGPERPWHATWFWRSLTLLGLGLALVALGEVQVISAGSGTPAPAMPDYTLLLPNLTSVLGFLLASVGATAALMTTFAALLNAARRRHRASRPQNGTRETGNHHTK
jgi:hypothetical protein